MTDETSRARTLRRLARATGWFAATALIALAAGVRRDIAPDALRARWATSPSRFITARGMTVHVRDEGPRDDPRPIVLLHGTSDSLHTWDGWVSALKGSRRVVRFDLRGFGLTGPAPDGDYRIEAYVRDTIAVLDALSIRRCVLGGNSLGGNIAWETALADRSRVEALLLVDAAGYPFAATRVPIGFRAARSPVFRPLVRWLTPRFMVASSVRNVFADPRRVSEALVDRFHDMALREGNRAALIERFRQSAPGEHAASIPRISVPTLVLWGAEDRLIPVDRAHRFKSDVPGADLVILPGVGHVPQQEDPTGSVRPVLDWLARLAPPAQG
jgi:pimeloyl-ACP methyl ester carboxylesterase